MSQARSLSRKFIREAAKEAGIELTKEFEQAIIEEHIASVSEAVDLAVTPLNEQLEAAKTTPVTDEYKEKYEKLFKAHEDLQTEIATKETNAKKQAAIRALVAEIGIGEKRHDIVLKSLTPDLDKIELDDKGNIKDVDALKTSISTDWAEFIETRDKKPAPNPTPPITTGGHAVSEEQFAKMTIRERSALKQKDPKEYERLTKRS